jgi:DMSO/TMAO reductase YedYZ molybdopterin-dependent catalytic subunit
MPEPITPISRRDVLKLLSLGGGAWILTACSRAESTSAPPIASTTPAEATVAAPAATTVVDLTPHAVAAEPTAFPTDFPDIPGLGELPDGFSAGRITPTADFYVQTSNGVAKPDPLTWELSLNGLFDSPMELKLSDLRSRPSVTLNRSLECIGNPVGGTLIGNAEWRGVSLPALLTEAGIQPDAQFILFYSEDMYETSIPLSLAMHEESYLVYEMNGEELDDDHGWPIRVLLPGVYGQKQPKWLVSIRASERDSEGTWEQKGWSNEATVKINSRIETPRLRQFMPAGETMHVTGIALSDYSGVASIDISINNGEDWMPANLLPGQDPGEWTLWGWTWENMQIGKYTIMARAVDGSGKTQLAAAEFGVLDNVFPDGTSFMHKINVDVI